MYKMWVVKHSIKCLLHPELAENIGTKLYTWKCKINSLQEKNNINHNATNFAWKPILHPELAENIGTTLQYENAKEIVCGKKTT